MKRSRVVALVARCRGLWPGRPKHFAAMDNVEHRGTERGRAVARTDRPHDGPAVLQALQPLPGFGGMRPVVGSWIVGDGACGMSIREDGTAIAGNRSWSVPHAIV